MHFGSGIEIEISGQNSSDKGRMAIGEVRSADSWIEAQRKSDVSTTDGQPISINEFLTESHHQYYGRPWILGRFYFDQMVRRSLKPTDRLLDLGCGSGRVAIWLIPYLQKSRYFGVDTHLRSLVAFAEYEALLHDLLPKSPRLLLDNKFSFGHFETEFDVMLDFSVTWGLLPDQIKLAYTQAHRHLRQGGRVMLAGKPRLSPEQLKSLGFELSHQQTVTYPIALPEKGVAGARDTDDWHELTRL
jgi:SAM-dependent methyltransferase